MLTKFLEKLENVLGIGTLEKLPENSDGIWRTLSQGRWKNFGNLRNVSIKVRGQYIFLCGLRTNGWHVPRRCSNRIPATSSASFSTKWRSVSFAYDCVPSSDGWKILHRTVPDTGNFLSGSANQDETVRSPRLEIRYCIMGNHIDHHHLHHYQPQHCYQHHHKRHLHKPKPREISKETERVKKFKSSEFCSFRHWTDNGKRKKNFKFLKVKEVNSEIWGLQTIFGLR